MSFKKNHRINSSKESSAGSTLKNLVRQRQLLRRSESLKSTDICTFAEQALGLRLWSRQRDILKACAKYPRVSVRSGHKIGKSISAVILGLYFWYRFVDARVIMTATTNSQIRNVLWRELKLRTDRALIKFPNVPALPNIGMRSEDSSREIVGISTNEAERMAGLSSPNMLFIVDEASGVGEAIFEAIEGNRAGGARIVMFSNPTQPVGTFYDSFHSKREFWHTMHVSSWEAAKADPHIPGIATRDHCDEKLAEWGPDDPRYQVRVEGNFADATEAAVIPLHAVMSAQQRYKEPRKYEGRIEIGCDVARFGDDETVISVRQGKVHLEQVVKRHLDEFAVARLVVEMANRHSVKGYAKALVKVDSCGLGMGVASILRVQPEVDVVMVDASEASDDPDKFINKRAQLWFGLSDWIKEGGCIPTDRELESDLLAPRYDFDAHERIQVEKKKDIKKRLRRSPDRADALALAVYSPRVRLVHPLDKARLASSRYRITGRGY